MKVLWVTNIIFPHLAKKLKKEIPFAGGWMYSLANMLSERSVELTVATVQKEVQEHFFNINDVDYYLISGKKDITKYDASLNRKWKKIVQVCNPDLVHIHGTEYAFGLSLMRSCPELPFVISIQGLTGVIGKYYSAGLKASTILRNITLRDIVKFNSVLSGKRNYGKYACIESAYLESSTDVIGRTSFDRSYVLSKNPKIKYHFCNELLRTSFYESEKWDVNSKQDHLIFLSQASYPLKGLHKVLEAVNLIKHDFPKIKIRIAGRDILKKSAGFKEKLKITGYAKYINSLLKKYNLRDCVSYIGPMDEKQMVNEYLECNVFICSSSIENSPNSIGEAQILGVPTIASSVGGIPDMIEHGSTGLLYEFGQVDILAQHIRKVFNDSSFVRNISKKSIGVATKRHDQKSNCDRTIVIYKEIINRKK